MKTLCKYRPNLGIGRNFFIFVVTLLLPLGQWHTHSRMRTHANHVFVTDPTNRCLCYGNGGRRYNKSPNRIKLQLNNERPTWCHLLFYFTAYVLNMFRILIYPSSGACDCAVELPHRSFCSRFVICWRFGAAGFEWCPCCRLQPASWWWIY